MRTRTLTYTVLTGGLAVAIIAWPLAAADATPKRGATRTFMRQKLLYSQLVLEGLTLEKFDLVTKNALRMRKMAEHNNWFIYKQPDYMRHTTNFHQSVDALYWAATEKKLDAATDAYLNVTRQCVECHRVVRGTVSKI